MRESIDLRHARDALFAIDPGCGREDWHRIGRAAIAAGLTVDDVDEWSRTAPNYSSEKDVRAAFRNCARRPNSDHPCRLNFDQGWKAVS